MSPRSQPMQETETIRTTEELVEEDFQIHDRAGHQLPLANGHDELFPLRVP